MGLSSKLPKHLTECSFQPEVWGEFPGIDGAVMLCNTHGLPGIGVYDFPVGEAVGTCDREYDESVPDWEQSNPPNRLLIAFRTANASAFEWWHQLTSQYDKSTEAWSVNPTAVEVAHARKVLGLAHRLEVQ